MNRSKTEHFAWRKACTICILLSLLCLWPYLSNAKSTLIKTDLLLLDTCPNIGILNGLAEICLHDSLDLLLSDWSGLDSIENGETNFGIEIVSFDFATANPYLGGNSLGVFSYEMLQNDTFVSLENIEFNTAGSFEVYAILNPIPIDSLCRPFLSHNLDVHYLPSALLNIVDPYCPEDTTGSIDLIVADSSPFTFEWFTDTGTGLVNGVEDQTNLSGGLFHVTITDGSLAACEQSYIAYLNDDDTTPPIINCPGNITEYLGSGACSAIISFALTSFDECSFFTGNPTITQIDTSGLSSGSIFPIGTTTLEYQAMDGSGNLSTCSFQIEVIEYQNPSQSLSCSNGLNVGLDENCMAIIGAQDLLTGGPYHCFDDYHVDLFYDEDLSQLLISSPVVTASEVGLTIYAKITDPETNNSCSGALNIQDNIIPPLHCSTYEVLCTDDFLPGNIGIPFPFIEDIIISPDSGNGPFTVTGFDPCGVSILTFDDVEEAGDCLEDDYIKRIIRTWTIEDASGNFTSCTDTMFVARSSIYDVSIPEHRDDISGVALSCSEVYELDAMGNPSPNETGWPSLNGVELVNDAICEIAVVYDDNIIDVCDGMHKVIRTWTVLSWCPSTVFFTAIQVILVKDDQGPEIDCSEDILISTGQNDCYGTLILPEPVLSDLCAQEMPNYTIEVSQGVLNGTVLQDIPIGETTVSYIASDACGNQSVCNFIVRVEDQIPPVPVCEFTQSISLSGGVTIVPASIFNIASFDNCDSISILARRLDNLDCIGEDDSLLDDFVPFYCCDLFSEHVLVELQISDANGNINTCEVEVIVNDNLNPEITCPSDLTLDCQENPYDLNLTGEATAMDNCDVEISFITQGILNDCNEGILVRIWTTQDASGNISSCTQQIEVINMDPFDINDITWPSDYSSNSCNGGLEPEDLSAPYNLPAFINNACDMITYDHEDLYLPINDPGCVAILRTWAIYNWCVFDPNNTNGEGIWTHTQLLEVINSEAPEIITDCDTEAFCAEAFNCETAMVQLAITAFDDCTDSVDLEYAYSIDLDNNGSIDINGLGFELIGAYPFGTHKVQWQVEDACGNISTCDQFFTVNDCTAPTINLLNGITTEIGSSASVEILANAWDNPNSPSNDNCGIAQWLVHVPSLGPGQTNPPMEAQATWIFDCDQLGTQNVDVWVQDINGLWSYVSTYIIIQDNDFPPDCPITNYMMINGLVGTEDEDLIENVVMEIETNAPGIPDIEYSNENGTYVYPELIPGGDYMILPKLNVNPLNGVSTFDLVKMTQHILELDFLDSPYQLIAADVNQSGSVSTIDVVQLRKMILLIDTVFQNNTSWRFVDADFVFPDPEDPFDSLFPEYYEVLEIQDTMEANFIGIKIGDLNGNATTTEWSSEEEVGSIINFKTNELIFQEGEEFNVEISCDNFNELLAFQSSIYFNPNILELIDIGKFNLDNLNANCFGYPFLEEGYITAAWFNALPISFDSAYPVFNIRFKAKSDACLSEVFDFNSHLINSEAYNDQSVLEVCLQFVEKESL